MTNRKSHTRLLILPATKIYPMTLDSGNIRFMRIFAGVAWRRASNNSGDSKTWTFTAFGRYVFGTSGNEANIISIFTITNCVSAIRLHVYRRAIYRIFFCCMTSPAETCGSGL